MTLWDLLVGLSHEKGAWEERRCRAEGWTVRKPTRSMNHTRWWEADDGVKKPIWGEHKMGRGCIAVMDHRWTKWSHNTATFADYHASSSAYWLRNSSFPSETVLPFLWGQMHTTCTLVELFTNSFSVKLKILGNCFRQKLNTTDFPLLCCVFSLSDCTKSNLRGSHCIDFNYPITGPSGRIKTDKVKTSD